MRQVVHYINLAPASNKENPCSNKWQLTEITVMIIMIVVIGVPVVTRQLTHHKSTHKQ